jgi:hypothetical protein
MSTTYTVNVKLGEPAVGDSGWGTTLNTSLTAVDALAPVGGLAVTTHEVPSASLNVDIAAGSFIKPDKTVGTYAGTTSYAIANSSTKVLYLDGTNGWALTTAASYPTTPHVRLATVVTGASTITSVTDNRQCFTAVGNSVVADTYGSTITFDLSLGLVHQVTLTGNSTLALANAQVGDRFIIILTQDATGSRTVTWFSTVLWAGGSAPTLTTTASKADMIELVCTAANTYMDMAISKNH